MVRIGHVGRVSPESVQEANASGVVPIVLSSDGPKYIIEDGKRNLLRILRRSSPSRRPLMESPDQIAAGCKEAAATASWECVF
jgi:hypothetical protein